MSARRNKTPFTKKPYREATFRHADITDKIEPPWGERLYRKIFRRDFLASDARREIFWRRILRLAKIIGACAALWAVLETLANWNIFD